MENLKMTVNDPPFSVSWTDCRCLRRDALIQAAWARALQYEEITLEFHM